MKRLIFAFAAVSGLACGSVAVAQNEVRIDINELTVDAGGPFGGETHTGPVNLSSHSLTRFGGISTSGGPFVVPPFGLTGLTGQIMLDTGNVVGAGLLITAGDGSTYSADFAKAGGVRLRAGGFVIDGLLSNGEFSGSTFAGVDVSAWSGNQLQGFFILSNFDPDPSGRSTVSNLDLIITPAPGSALLLGMGALAFGTRRRR